MATLRDIRRRIGSVKSIQKITKAMKMVAAAKFRRAQEGILQARPYARKIRELLRDLSDAEQLAAHPLLTPREVRTVALVVVTADRGLCGAFNSNIIRTATHRIRAINKGRSVPVDVKLYCIGKRGVDFFGKRGLDLVGRKVQLFQSLSFHTAQEIARELIGEYTAGTVDRIELIYNEFKSVVEQRIVTEDFLPVPRPADPADAPGQQKAKRVKADYIFEPSLDCIIEELLPKYLNFEIWRVLLESNAAEQGARMTAMDNATTNASDLIGSLQLSYNKARQAAITKELLEIVSGAEALKQAG